jgi:hypothetical protein
MDVIHSTTQDTPAATNNNNSVVFANAPSRTSLQGLPPELRNNIFKYVAATQDRYVLGRRFHQSLQFRQDRSLIEHLHSSVALHPLSVTCRQMQAEFSGLHLAASESRWVLVVNNFDVEQVEGFGGLVDGFERDTTDNTAVPGPGYFKVVDWDYDDSGHYETPIHSPTVVLRFQMDRDARKMANYLYEEVSQYVGETQMPWRGEHDDPKGAAFGFAEIVTTYTPYYSAEVDRKKSMTLRQAKDFECMLKYLSRRVGDILSDEPWLTGLITPYAYIEQCWFDPFFAAVEAMRSAREKKLKLEGLEKAGVTT